MSPPEVKLQKVEKWTFAAVLLAPFVVLSSVIPAVSFFAYIDFFVVISFFWIARFIFDDPKAAHHFSLISILAGIVYGIYGLLQYFGVIDHSYWYRPDSLASRFVNGSHFAVWFLAPIFFAHEQVLVRRGISRVLFFAILLIFLYILILTRARAAWVGYFAGLIFFIVYSGQLTSLKERKNRLFFFIILTLVLTLGIVTKTAHVFMDRFQELFHSESGGGLYSLKFRWFLWGESISAFLARPWGWGLGVYRYVLPAFRTHTDRFVIDYAHNELLQIAVEGGLGLIFLTGYFFRNLYFCFSQRRDQSPSQTPLMAALGAILLSIFLTSLADFPLRIFAITLLVTAVIAMTFSLRNVCEPPMDPVSGRHERPSRWFQKSLAAYLGCLVIFFSVVSFFHARAEMFYQKAQGEEKRFLWDEADSHYREAIHAMPIDFKYAQARGALFQKKTALSAGEKKKGNRQEAIRMFKKALSLNSRSAPAHHALARLLEQNKQVPEATGHFQKALSLEPRNGFLVLEYAYFALRHLSPKEAVAAFERFQKTGFLEDPRCNACVILKAAAPKITDPENLKKMVDSSSRAHYCLGVSFGELGRWPIAKVEFEESLQLFSKNDVFEAYVAYARSPVAEFYERHKRYQDAIHIYKISLARYPHDAGALRKIQELESKLFKSEELL